MTQIINTAILGYGKSARQFHTPLLKSVPGFAVKSVLQRSKDDAKRDFKSVKIIRDLKDLLKDDSIELVVITTPNHLHYEQALDCLYADKHVVVEKPFTITSEQAEKLIRTAGDRDKVLTVFQNRRWDGDFLTLRKIINEGQLGTILELESNYNRFRRLKNESVWKETSIDGSGILYDLSPHLIDQAVQMFGMPDRVFADIRHQRGGSADDWFQIELFYNGLKVTLRAGMLVFDPTPRFVLRGDQGSYVKHGLDVQEEQLASGILPDSEDWGRESASGFGSVYIEKGGVIKKETVETVRGNYAEFYTRLRDSILHKKDPPVEPESAKKVIKIIEMAVLSNQQKSAVNL